MDILDQWLNCPPLTTKKERVMSLEISDDDVWDCVKDEVDKAIENKLQVEYDAFIEESISDRVDEAVRNWMYNNLEIIMGTPEAGPTPGVKFDVQAKDLCPHDMVLLPHSGWCRVRNVGVDFASGRVRLDLTTGDGVEFFAKGWTDDWLSIERW